MQPWDGVGWRSTCCVVIAFMLNGPIVPLMAYAASVGADAAVTGPAVVAAVLTIAAILMRVHGRQSTALRVAAIGANAAFLAHAVISWRNAAALNAQQIVPSWDLALMGLAASANTILLLASPRIHVSREISICLNCGYEVGASSGRGCPECGWRRVNEAADTRG